MGSICTEHGIAKMFLGDRAFIVHLHWTVRDGSQPYSARLRSRAERGPASSVRHILLSGAQIFSLDVQQTDDVFAAIMT